MLSFDESGVGKEISLADVQQLAIDHGFEKANMTPGKPLAQRADLKGFFEVYGTNAFTPFKKKFMNERLAIPESHKNTAKKALAFDDDVQHTSSENEGHISNYEKNVEKFQALKWKFVQKPGGQALKPPIWYDLNAAMKQLTEGDVSSERPMWREDGSIDYAGQSEWDARNKVKGVATNDIKVKFAKDLEAAMADPTTNFYG